MKKALLIVLLFMMIIPFSLADLIVPGEKTIPVTNTITNIEDFPDYIFVVDGALGDMCLVGIVDEDGSIPSTGYRYCGGTVYAIKKTDAALISGGETNETGIRNLINSSKAIKVLEDISFRESTTIADARESITREYTISLNLAPTNEPSNISVERNPWVYAWYLIPVIAIIIVVFVLVKRKQNESP